MLKKEDWMKPLFFRVLVGFACALVVAGCLSRQTESVKQNPSKKYDAAHVAGGTGDSYETAVLINGGKDYADAEICENGFIANAWGAKDKDWRLMEKTTVVENGRTYDMVQVEIPKVGEKHFYYFDITRYKKKQKSAQSQEASEPSNQKATTAPGQTGEPKQPAQPLEKQGAASPQALQPAIQSPAPAAQPTQALEPKASTDTAKAPAGK
jgi:hypothetical protein